MAKLEYTQHYSDYDCDVKVVVDHEQDIQAGASRVSIDIYVNSASKYYIEEDANWSFAIDGVDHPYKLWGSNIKNVDNVCTNAPNLVIPHSRETGIRNILLTFNIPIIFVDERTNEETEATLSFNHSFSLGYIVEKLFIDNVTGDIGGSQTMYISGEQSSTLYRIEAVAKIGDTEISIEPNTAFTIPNSVLENYPNSQAITVVYDLEAWALDPYGTGNDIYLGKDTKTISHRVSNTKAPTLSMSVVDAAGHAGTASDPYVMNKTNLRVTLNVGAVAGSSLTLYRVTIGGQEYSSRPLSNTIVIDTGVMTSELTTQAIIPIAASIVDSRGMKTSTPVTYAQFAPYTQPSVDTVHVIRCNYSGTELITGDNFKLDWSGEHVHTGYTLQKTVRYRKKGLTSWTTDSSPVSGKVYHNIDISSPYEIQLIVSDGETTITYSTVVSSATIICHRHQSGKGFAFGGLCTGEEFQVHMPARFTNSVKGLLDNLDGGAGGSIDDLTEPGFYYLTTGGYSDLPDTTNGWLMVMQGGSGSYIFRLQEFTTIAGFKYFRVAYNNSWGSWQRVSTITV